MTYIQSSHFLLSSLTSDKKKRFYYLNWWLPIHIVSVSLWLPFVVEVFLTLIFKSLIMMCFSIDFFALILLDFSQVLWPVGLCLSPNLRSFQPLYLLSWDFNDMNIGSFIIAKQVPEFLLGSFIFQFTFSQFFMMSIFYCSVLSLSSLILSSVISTLLLNPLIEFFLFIFQLNNFHLVF